MTVVRSVGADPAHQGEGVAFGLALGVRIATARASSTTPAEGMTVVRPVGADPAHQGEGVAFGLALRQA
jgi:hypothetical protein